MRFTSLVKMVIYVYLSFLSLDALAFEFPPKPLANNFVVDSANILSAKEINSINEINTNLVRDENTQIVVVTIPSLTSAAVDNLTIDNYIDALFKHLGFGNEGNRGVLILIVKDSQVSRVRFYLTNGLYHQVRSTQIQQKLLIPLLQQKNYATAIMEAVVCYDLTVRNIPYTNNIKKLNALEKSALDITRFFKKADKSVMIKETLISILIMLVFLTIVIFSYYKLFKLIKSAFIESNPLLPDPQKFKKSSFCFGIALYIGPCLMGLGVLISLFSDYEMLIILLTFSLISLMVTIFFLLGVIFRIIDNLRS